MESIIIIVIGLVFSILSKSAKEKKDVNEEREKRKRQLQTSTNQRSSANQSKQRSLRELFMDELKKAEDDEIFGEVIKTFRGNEPEAKIEEVQETETVKDNYYGDSYLSNEEVPNYDISNPITQSEPDLDKAIGEINSITRGEIKNNRQYNPFTKSLNRKDIIRGIIFSEVMNKPKSLREQKRSM